MIWFLLVILGLISSSILTGMWLVSEYQTSKKENKEDINFEMSEMPTLPPTPTPIIEKNKRGRKSKKI